MRIFSIVGARPQFIKLAPLSQRLKINHEEIIVHTGQHYDFLMSEKIFQDLGIRNPDIHLGTGSGSHAYQTAEMMKALENAMVERKPDLVIVFGDTNSTLAGSLASAKLKIPILHIEAGLRSFNRNMPEEINRVATDHISEYLFAPTLAAVQNLKLEGLSSRTVLSGDIMVDTMNQNLEIAVRTSDIMKQLKLDEDQFTLLTLHRDYNVDDQKNLQKILSEVCRIDTKIVFPVHPRTRKMIQGIDISHKNLVLTEPLGYLDFITLEHFSRRIVTDSGGIQKEAYILKKPCITLRTETEWVETVEEGWNCLINPNGENFANKILSFCPPNKQNQVFGSDVAKKMEHFINQLR